MFSESSLSIRIQYISQNSLLTFLNYLFTKHFRIFFPLKPKRKWSNFKINLERCLFKKKSLEESNPNKPTSETLVTASKKNIWLRKWLAIKNCFLEWSQKVQCECFPRIFEKGTNNLNRLIWTFLFLIFSTLTCYLLSQNVLDYLRQEREFLFWFFLGIL